MEHKSFAKYYNFGPYLKILGCHFTCVPKQILLFIALNTQKNIRWSLENMYTIFMVYKHMFYYVYILGNNQILRNYINLAFLHLSGKYAWPCKNMNCSNK
jgi:hypothetical protein